MIYPMRRYDYNINEVFLSSMVNLFAWMLLALGILRIIFPHWFGHPGRPSDATACATIACGLLLGLGSGGVRQNRAVLNMGLRLLLLLTVAWLLLGGLQSSWWGAIVGAGLAAQYALSIITLREAVRARFNPRYLTLREFQTVVQVADVMLDDEKERLHPIAVALRTDHLLATIDSPIKKDIRLVLFLVEWLAPLLVFRLAAFSELGTHSRRQVVQKVIWSKGPFRDVARTLKLLTTFSFYTHPDVRRSVGYTEVDAGERRTSLNKTPYTYPLPNNQGPQNRNPQNSNPQNDDGGPTQ